MPTDRPAITLRIPIVRGARRLPCRGFADKYGERTKVVVSGLAHIIGAETIADYRCVDRIKLIRHEDDNICLGIVIWHIRLLVQL